MSYESAVSRPVADHFYLLCVTGPKRSEIDFRLRAVLKNNVKTKINT